MLASVPIFHLVLLFYIYKILLVMLLLDIFEDLTKSMTTFFVMAKKISAVGTMLPVLVFFHQEIVKIIWCANVSTQIWELNDYQ